MEIKKKMLKTFIISLRRTPHRSKILQQQLQKQNINFELFEAVDGMSLDLSQYKKRIKDRFLKIRRGFGLTRGEIGCFLSHYTLWEWMLKQQIPYILILEDDVRIEINLLNVLNQLVKTEWYWEVINLMPAWNTKLVDRCLFSLDSNHNLVRFSSYTGGGTVSYLISLEGAKKLLKFCFYLREPIDNLYEKWWLNKVKFYSINPPIFLHFREDTTILNRESSKENFFLFRFRTTISNLYFDYHERGLKLYQKKYYPTKRADNIQNDKNFWLIKFWFTIFYILIYIPWRLCILFPCRVLFSK